MDFVFIFGRYEIVVRFVFKNVNGEIGILMLLIVFVNLYKLGVVRIFIDVKNIELYICFYNLGDCEIIVLRNIEIVLFVLVIYVS